MALASWPVRWGLQRCLVSAFQVLSWALARSPGPHSRAWARLAAFCDSGLLRPLYGGDHCPADAVVALIAQSDQPASRRAARMFQIRAAAVSCTLPGSAPDTHSMVPSGAETTCRFIPCLRCLPE